MSTAPAHRRTAIAAALFVACASSASFAQSEIQPQLIYPEGRDNYSVNDDIVIRYDPQSAQFNDSWLVQLDAVDVTALAIRSGYGLLRLRPVKRLEAGMHRLRLVRETAAGNLIEVAAWDVELHAGERAFDTRLFHASDIQGNSTVLNSDDLDAYREHGVNGSLLLDAGASAGSFAARGAANLYGSSNAERLGQDEVELGDFRISGRSESVELVAGHFAAAPIDGQPYSNLAYDGMSRRGLGISTRLPFANAAFTAFSQGSEPISGFRRGFAVSRPEQRLSGGMLELQPYASDRSRIGLTLGYVEGRGLSGGTAVYDAANSVFVQTAGVDGNVGNAVVDAQWLSGALNLRAEYARSERQFPMLLGMTLDPVTDDAQRYALTYQSLEGIALGGYALNGYVTLEHELVGTAFRSIAAPGGLIDLDQNRLAAGLQYATLSLDLSAARSEDNVADAPFPTTRADNLFAQLSWSPELGGWTLSPLLQQPSLSIGAGRDQRRTVKLPDTDDGFRSDDESRSLTTSLSFTQPLGGWSVNYSRSANDDHTGQSQAYRGDSGSVDASFYFGERVSLNAQIFTDLSRQLQLRSGDGADFEFFLPESATRSQNGSLSLQWQLVPERWQLALGYAVNRSRTSDRSFESRGRQVDFSSTWTVWRLNLFLRGSYQHLNDRSLILPFEDEAGMPSAPEVNRSRRESYQAFAGFSLSFSGE